MELGSVILIITVGLLVFIFSGQKIFVAIGMVGLIGLCFLIPYQPGMLAQEAWECLNNFTFTAVPMFVLMGQLFMISGIADALFNGVAKWLGRFPGGLAHSILVASAIFSAISGSSTANAAAMGTISFPEMMKRGYDPKVILGVLNAGATVDIMIPPSIPMIIYGSMCGVSIGKCYMAGIIPGMLLILCFMVTLVVWSWLRPEIIPKSIESFSWRRKC